MSRAQHIRSILALPLLVTIVIPTILILLSGGINPLYSVLFPIDYLLLVFSILSIFCGLSLLYQTISLFASVGSGTLAPWAPTKKLVVEGVYRRVRNPMISGVLLILFGEFLILGSLTILGWCLFFLIGNHIYFIKSEEPGLENRFGDEYLRYKDNVPRWIPMRNPWNPEED